MVLGAGTYSALSLRTSSLTINLQAELARAVSQVGFPAKRMHPVQANKLIGDQRNSFRMFG